LAAVFHRRSMKRRPMMKRSLVCVVLLLTLNGSGSFHFDENLARNSNLSRGYIVTSWKEL